MAIGALASNSAGAAATAATRAIRIICIQLNIITIDFDQLHHIKVIQRVLRTIR